MKQTGLHSVNFGSHSVEMVDDMYRLNDVVVAIGMHPKYAFQIAKKISTFEKVKIQTDTAIPRGRSKTWFVTLEGLGQWAYEERCNCDKVAKAALRRFVDSQLAVGATS